MITTWENVTLGTISFKEVNSTVKKYQSALEFDILGFASINKPFTYDIYLISIPII